MLITWTLHSLQILTHSFSAHFVYSMLCHHSSLPQAPALFLITLIFNVNIREVWFQICSVLAHWQSLIFMASSLDCSKTGFIFKVPHCILLALQYLLAIRRQQDRTHEKEEKHPNIFFPLFHILPKPSLEWLKGGVFLSLFSLPRTGRY